MNQQERYFVFLDELRESGKTNMFGAGRYLQKRFPVLDRVDANKVLVEWMRTFGERHPRKGEN